MLIGQVQFLIEGQPWDIAHLFGEIQLLGVVKSKAEFRAMAHGFYEGMWLKRLLQELHVTMAQPILVLCDNQSVISVAKNSYPP